MKIQRVNIIGAQVKRAFTRYGTEQIMLGCKLHCGTFKYKGKSGWTGASPFGLEICVLA